MPKVTGNYIAPSVYTLSLPNPYNNNLIGLVVAPPTFICQNADTKRMSANYLYRSDTEDLSICHIIVTTKTSLWGCIKNYASSSVKEMTVFSFRDNLATCSGMLT